MAIKKYNPITPGRRTMTAQDFTMISCHQPKKTLTSGRKNQAGRNSSGRITVRHRGGGVKRRWRELEFSRLETGPAKVISIEYDPNRSARIALIEFKGGKNQYIIAPHNLMVGGEIFFAEKTPIEIGNRLPLKNIPIGTIISEIELRPKSGGKVCRSAGSASTLLAIDGKSAMIKLPSGEIRHFLANCNATIGQVSNIHHNQVVIGKAGRKRLLGIRPTVRGKAMNPVSHPHGGGEGNNPIGLKAPKTKWGAKALGVKTRPKKKNSNILIIRRRKKR